MSLSKRTRFEVLKRDGFSCRYCGATAIAGLLEVDHVIPVAEGGLDVPENLVAACLDCNRGKSAVPLDESRLSPGRTTEAMLEHAEQMRAYLAAVQEVEDAIQDLVDHVIRHWQANVDEEGMPTSLAKRMPYYLRKMSMPRILEAVEITGSKGLRGALATKKYFVAVARNMMSEES